ncbi:sensor histidine kinase, partial [Pontibacter sp. JAM-7]|uniref:sensor histidine kinase n=1 Tax=Pontibacter sp. JAM-7 TaxID=3366581 RepID=UPI003AF53C52
AHNLNQLSFNNVPAELNPLVNEINRLMAELAISLERQKRFTSNAAHELRTPLAAIKVHAQNLFPEDERTRRIQQNIVQGIDRLAHMFNQLITLSRVEAADRDYMLQTLQLKTQVAEVLQELQGEIDDKRLQVAVQLNDTLQAETNRDVLQILLRNLLGNAVRYTPEGGTICIDALPAMEGTGLVISDSGPGLNAEQKQLVFDRFYRASGQNTDGCGIGLSIVREICEHFGYQVQLLDSELAETGLRVELRFKV